MPLRLLVGPANAGKVALLLDRYLEAITGDPWLVVPNRGDVERVERDLVARAGCLLGGTIGTFDDLFGEIAAGAAGPRAVLGDAQRTLAVRRAVAAVRLDGLGRSARYDGFAESLGAVLAELEAGLVDPPALDGELAALHGAYRAELDRLGRRDRDGLRRLAADRIRSDLAAWSGKPVFAYGFEDLTAAEWTLLEALVARTEVTVSLPYEPGRPVFASLERTAADLASLAGGSVVELPPANALFAHPAIAHLERGLFSDSPPAEAPRIEGAVRFLEGAGARGTLELVADEIAAALRDGVAAGQIGVVVPSLERYRTAFDTAFGGLGIPFRLEGELRLRRTVLGHALVSLLRFAWLDGGRRDLYAFLRSAYSGIPRREVDFLEGRLRGRAVRDPARVEATTLELRGRPIDALEVARLGTPLDAVRDVVRGMVRAAQGLEAPAADTAAWLDLCAHEAIARLLDELREWEGATGSALSREELVGSLESLSLWLPGGGDPGRVAVLDLMQARTRHFAVVFVLGLEEGGLPRRGQVTPFLDDEARRGLGPAARLERADPVERDRYLFYTACARASKRLFLVREAASDEGSPRQAGPFWDEARALFPSDEVARWTRRRALSALTWPLEEAPSERERLRAVAALASKEASAAEGIALANGWDRRLARALDGFSRPTALRNPLVVSELARRTSFSVTELESFGECSSMWLFERVISPRTIDAEVDARLRGSLAHTVLFRFYSGLPRRLGIERVDEAHLEAALDFLRGCLEEAVRAQAGRLELRPVELRELEQGLLRDLEAFVRSEAESEVALVPRRFEVSFGSERSAPELQRGLVLGDFSVSGKIDRIDQDLFSARGIVQDYKSGQSAHSAAEIERTGKLQVPLYMLVLRDLVGIEPIGGLYRALAGERKARGMLRADARDDGVPGFSDRDYLDEERFWAVVDGAVERAQDAVGRMRAGDVAHDPRDGECPSWCDLWTMCRVRRA